MNKKPTQKIEDRIRNSRETNSQKSYLDINIADAFRDPAFKRREDWGKLMNDYNKIFPEDNGFNFKKVEKRLADFQLNEEAYTDDQKNLFHELIKVKKDYSKFLYKVRLSRQTKKETQNSSEIASTGLLQTETRLSQEDKQKIDKIRKAFVSFKKIISDKEFMRILDFNDFQRLSFTALNQTFSGKDINWNTLDKEFLKYKEASALNKTKTYSKNVLQALDQLEQIENTFVGYKRHKKVKEDLKSIDSIIPKSNVNKTQKELHPNSTVKSKHSKQKLNFCTRDCVNICHNNFIKIKDFLSCSKSACLCSEFEIISKSFMISRYGHPLR